MTAKSHQKFSPEPQGPDITQITFWFLLAIVIIIGAYSTTQYTKGAVFWSLNLIAISALACVFVFWIRLGYGRTLGLFPTHNAIKGAYTRELGREVLAPDAWVEALDEAAIITDQNGARIQANCAYRALASDVLGDLNKGSELPSLDALFKHHPTLRAALFRLPVKVRPDQPIRQVLPSIVLKQQAEPVSIEAVVSALPEDQYLWRLRRLEAVKSVRLSDPVRELYLEKAPIGIIIAKADMTLSYANKWARQTFDLAADKSPKTLEDLLKPELVKLVHRQGRIGQSGFVDITLPLPDGSQLPVMARFDWLNDSPQSLVGVYFIPKYGGLRAEQGANEQAAYLAAPIPEAISGSLEDAPFGAVSLQGPSIERTVIGDMNQAFMELIEGEAGEGSYFADIFIAPDPDDKVTDLLLQAIDKPVELKLAKDKRKTVNVFVSLNAQAQPCKAYVIDMTEQKQLEMRLAQGEKMQAIGQLAGGIAHDFNNVLTGIMLNTDKLIMRHPLGDPSFTELKLISELSYRAAELVKMLLAYARKQTFKHEALDITDSLSGLYILLRQLVDERIELDIHHGRNLPYIRVDKTQLETAIINLVTNARDAMLSDGQGGKLIIRTKKARGAEAQAAGFTYVTSGDYLLIEVEDTGHGISQENIEKVFTPFFTTKAPGLGTGLGLATVYGIIKQSGGHIFLTSKIGKGTCFHIYLPALPEAEIVDDTALLQNIASERRAARLVDTSGRGKILLVEDEIGVRGIAAQLLLSRGYEVMEAEDGEEALEILQKNSGGFDLIISDVVMPGMDGPTLINTAQEHLGHARIIFISGYAERDLADLLEAKHTVSFLPKPFTVSQLAEKVKYELSLTTGDVPA